MVGFRGNSQRAVCVFVYVSVVFIKIGGSHIHESHPYNPSPYRIPCKPKYWLSSAASVCLGVCLRVSGWVCEQECVFSLSQSVRAKDEVSAISDRGEYVFLSTARRMEKSGSNDYP